MGLALSGLIIFQFYWINSATKANEERFRKDVLFALNRVAEKLEKREALHAAYDNFNSNFKWHGISKKGKNSLEVYESSFKKKIISLSDIDSTLQLPYDISFYFESSAKNNLDLISETENRSYDKAVFKLEKNLDELANSKFIEEKIRNAAKKSAMVQVVIHELLNGKGKTADRINAKELDSLLEFELSNKGIDLEFIYGVVDPSVNKMVFHSKNSDQTELKTSELKTSLFPNNIIGDQSQLMVHFPDKSSYLLQKIWLPLTSSVILVLIILFCFAYSIQTILKQKKLSEIKNDFINNMTHELKTPISTISLATEALQDPELSINADINKRYISMIREENTRLSRQVEKVLEIAVVERNDFKLKNDQVDLHKIIEMALKNIKIQLDQRSGKIEKKLNAKVSELSGDEMHLTNIIYNLLDNANKYSPDKPRIIVETQNVSDGIEIAIKDNGIGMTYDTQSKIFDKFYRVPTGNLHDVKGFGLGLAYVKNMVEAHQGQIQVKSEINKGSTFKIYFPL